MQKHKSYNLVLGVGESTLKERITLDPGTVVGGFIVVDNKANLGAGFVNIGIDSAGGKEIVDDVHVTAWEQRQGGDYYGSIKPFSITENAINVNVNADTAIPATAVNFQLVLVYNCVN